MANTSNAPQLKLPPRSNFSIWLNVIIKVAVFICVFFPLTVDVGVCAPSPFLITHLNQMLIPRYCQNKQSKYGKPEDDGSWHSEQVRARWAHLPEQRWSALTTRHGPAVPGCHCARTREQLPGPASRQSICQPQGAPFLKARRLSCPPCGCKYSLIFARTLFTMTNAWLQPN